MGLEQNNKQMDITIPDSLLSALIAENEFAARRAFFDLLITYTENEIRKLRYKINYLLKNANLGNLDVNKIFSLKAMHNELMDRISRKDNEDRITLLINNQWIKAFYGETNDKNAKDLYDSIRQYALALTMKKNNRIDKEMATNTATIAGIISFALFFIALGAVADDLWATAMISTQIACIGFFAIAKALDAEKHEEAFQTEHNKLKNLKLTETIENETPLAKNPNENAANLEFMKLHIINLIGALDWGCNKQYRADVFECFIGYKSRFHECKDINPTAYAAVCASLREIEAPYQYKRQERDIFLGYVMLSAFASALVALSIGLNHTKDVVWLLIGSLLGVCLGTAALAQSALMVIQSEACKDHRPPTIPDEKIDALKKIWADLNKKQEPKLPLASFRGVNAAKSTIANAPPPYDSKFSNGYFTSYQMDKIYEAPKTVTINRLAPSQG